MTDEFCGMLQALETAAELRLNKSLVASITSTSYLLSAVCMGLVALTAWSRDIVPIFASMTSGTATTFPLVDQCILQLALLSLAAVFGPRLFVRKVVKMTVSAEQFLKQQGDTEPPASAPEQPRPTATSAVAPRQTGHMKVLPKPHVQALRRRQLGRLHQFSWGRRCRTLKA